MRREETELIQGLLHRARSADFGVSPLQDPVHDFD
jgi:hypothetical protein